MLGDSYHQPVSVCSKNTGRDRLEAQFHQERCAMLGDSYHQLYRAQSNFL